MFDDSTLPALQPTQSGGDRPWEQGTSSLNDLYVVSVSDDVTASIYQSLANSGRRVLKLDTTQSVEDLIKGIAEQTEARASLKSIHIFSHGAEGSFWIGGEQIDTDTITGISSSLRELGSALDDQGDVLIYGCNVAAGREGARMLKTLADITGADVAASTDWTGNGGSSADWELEASTGSIEAIDHNLAATLASTKGTLAVSAGTSVTSASYIDSNGDQVDIRLSGPGSFRIWLVGGATDQADATTLELTGTDSTSSLKATVTPRLLDINAGSIDAGANGQYNRMYSAGYTNINSITSSDSNAIGDIYLSGVAAKSIDLMDLSIDTLTLDAAYTTYVDRVNTSTLGASVNLAAPTIGIGPVSAQAEFEIFDETTTGPSSNTYNPVTGLVELGDISAMSIKTLSINGAISADTNSPFDSSRLTNDFNGTVDVKGRIGAIKAHNSALTGAVRAGSIGSIDLGMIQGEISTTDLKESLTLTLPSEFRGFISAAGHLNLGFSFDYPDPGDTVPPGEKIYGEIRAGGGISGTEASLADTIFLPNKIFNLLHHTGKAVAGEPLAVGSTISNSIANIAINGLGTVRINSAGNIGTITANSFETSMIVEAAGDIGNIESLLFSEIPNPQKAVPPEPPVPVQLGGFFQAGGNIGDVKSATGIVGQFRAGGNIGNVTALSGGIDSALIEAGNNIGSIWAHQQEVANQGKIIAKTGNIGDVYLGLGDWGTSLKAGTNIGAIRIDKGALQQVRFAAGGLLKSLTVNGSVGGIIGGSIIADDIGSIAVSTTTGTAIDGALIQATDSLESLNALSYATTTLPVVTPGIDSPQASGFDGIRNSQILAGDIGQVTGRSYTGSGITDTVIHAQKSSIDALEGHGNQSGLLRVTAVAQQDIGPIQGIADVQGSGIEASSFSANTGNIASIRGQGGVAGGHGIASSYFQASDENRPGSIGDITALSNANLGDALHEVTAYAGTFGTIQATVLGGEGTEPQAPPPPFPNRDPLGSGIVRSYFKGYKNLPNDATTPGIKSVIVNVSSLYGYGIFESEFSVKDDISSIDVKSFNNSAITDSSFSSSQGDINSIYAQALNKGTGLLRATFIAENGNIGVGSEASITAKTKSTALTDDGIAESLFQADENIGWINAYSAGGSAIKASTFVADNDLSSSGKIQKVVATTNGQNYGDSSGIANSTFTAEQIGPIEVEVQNYEGGAGILGSTFTTRTAKYDGNGNVDNRGSIESIKVVNQSRTGNGIEASRFYAGAAGSIGDITVDVVGNKTDAGSGKAIYLSTFQASGFDMDQNTWNGKIGNITVKAGRVIPTLLPSLAGPPNEQVSLAAAGIDLSYFAGYGGIGNITIDSIGTAVFGSAFLADFDVANLTNAIGGTILSALAAPVQGNLGDITIRANGRFATGATLSLFTGAGIGNINIEANAINIQQAPPALPTPKTPLETIVIDLLTKAAGLIPGGAEILTNILKANERFGLAAVVGSAFAALDSNIGSISITNTGATKKSALGSIFFAKGQFGPCKFTPEAKSYDLVLSAAATVLLRALGAGYGPAAVFLPDAVLLYGQSRGTLPDNVNQGDLPTATLELPPNNAPYIQGAKMTFVVNFGGQVIVTGQPSLTVRIGDIERIATYSGGSGSSTLMFTYVVQDGDEANSTQPVSVATVLNTDSSNKIVYQANQAQIDQVTVSVMGDPSKLIVDGIAPKIVAWDKPNNVVPKAGKVVSVTANFSEVVIVNGRPTISATIGETKRKITLTYERGSGTSALVFSYTLSKEDVANITGDQFTLGKTILLSGARITDSSGNNAVLTDILSAADPRLVQSQQAPQQPQPLEEATGTRPSQVIASSTVSSGQIARDKATNGHQMQKRGNKGGNKKGKSKLTRSS